MNKAKRNLTLLDKNHYTYCHWKSNEHLGAGIAGRTDLDILVGEEQINDAREILGELGFKKFSPQPWSDYPYMEDWLGVYPGKERIFHIDLHEKLPTGKKYVKEYLLPWQDKILESRVKNEEHECWTTEPHVEMVLLLVRVALKLSLVSIGRSFFRKNYLPPDLKNEFDYLKKQINQKKLKDTAEEMTGEKTAGYLAEIVDKEKIFSFWPFLKLKKLVKNEADLEKTKNTIQASFLSLFYMLNIKIQQLLEKLNLKKMRRKRLPNEGRVIAVIGSDGSGKSTMVNKFQKMIKSKVEISSYYLGSWLGAGGLYSLVLRSSRFFYRLLTGKSSDGGPGSSSTDAGESERSYPVEIYLALMKLWAAKLRLKKLRKAWKQKKKGRIIITDRYPQKQFTGLYDGPALQEWEEASGLKGWLAKKEKKIYNQISKYIPDVVVKLHLSPEESKNRKPDHSFANIKQKNEITKKLSFPDSTVIDIDAAQPLEETFNEFARKTWKAL